MLYYSRYEGMQVMKKVTFQLSPTDRIDMMSKIINIVGERLHEHKMAGTKFKDIAKAIGVPKERISEIYNQKYINERTLRSLLHYGWIDAGDLLSPELSDNQLKVIEQVIGQA